jgi:DNA-binding LytR/AlgR family response regulator
MYKVLLIEDDELSVALVERNLSFFSNFSLDYVAGSVADAINYLSNNHVQVVFLDIELPDGEGFSIIPYLTGNPAVIVLTGNERYAFTAFENGVLDFLKKPLTPARFKISIEKISTYLKQQTGNNTSEIERPFLFVKSGHKHIKVNIHELMYAEAVNDYAKLHLITGKNILINISLKDLLQRLAKYQFNQVHRSYVVNMQHIELVDDDTIFMKEHQIPIGKTFKSEVSKLLK